MRVELMKHWIGAALMIGGVVGMTLWRFLAVNGGDPKWSLWLPGGVFFAGLLVWSF